MSFNLEVIKQIGKIRARLVHMNNWTMKMLATEVLSMIRLNDKTKEQYAKVIWTAIQAEAMLDFRQTFMALHPSDQVDIFLLLGPKDRQTVYAYLSPKEMAVLFGGFKFAKQKLYFDEMDELYASTMLHHMFTDDIVHFLSKIGKERSDHILKQIPTAKAKKIQQLLSYEKETAGAIMTKELISISSTETVTDVLNMLRDEAPDAEIVYYLYVLDEDGKLVGVVSLRDLIIAKPNVRMEEIMSRRVISVPDVMDQEEVGKVIQKYDLLAVPVVSKQNHLLGIVTVDDMMDILEAETTEDFGEISATKGATDIHIGSFSAAKKRSPWIIALMFFGLLTGGIIGRFEDTLESVVLLAAFIPMIMDSAGNVGTQSLAVSVRGLALGTIEKNSVFKIIRRELGTGIWMGLACMIIITIIISLLYQHPALGLIVGVSIFCTLSASAVIGAVVPLLIHKLKFDPAIASGPFITTLNDIIGLLIYFTIATSFLHLL